MNRAQTRIYGYVILFVGIFLMVKIPIESWVLNNEIERLRKNGHFIVVPTEGEFSDSYYMLRQEYTINVILYSILLALGIVLLIRLFFYLKSHQARFGNEEVIFLDEEGIDT